MELCDAVLRQQTEEIQPQEFIPDHLEESERIIWRGTSTDGSEGSHTIQDEGQTDAERKRDGETERETESDMRT